MSSRELPVLLVLLVSVAGGADAADQPCAVDQPMDNPEWVATCNAAIQCEEDPRRRAALLFGRAYFAVEQYRYDDAMEDLEAALAADPDCISCLHERAYLNGELGNFAQAIVDLNREIELNPKSTAAYRERAYSRMYSGDLAGAYQDSARNLELRPDSVDSLLARASAAMWLGRFDEAATDTAQAQARATKAGDDEQSETAARRQVEIGLWRKTSAGRNPARRCVADSLDSSDSKLLIGDCTRAFLDAKDAAARADALTSRSIGWTVLMNSPDNAAVDMRVAAGLDPGKDFRHINLGYAFLATSHSWAARREFERALELKRSWMALAGRAAARVNLHDTEGAVADALESTRMEPNQMAAGVLADIAYDEGDQDRAREMYLWTYRLGSRDHRLIERLKELGITDPASAKIP